MIFQNNKIQKGFTLIELLVVMSIVSLVSSVIFASFNSARAKGRDSKRISELRQIKTALEIYYNDKGQYPNSLAAVASSGAYNSGWSTLLSSSYMTSMPNDPINTTAQYGYYYAPQYKQTGNCIFVSTGLATTYVLATRLENTSASANSCSATFGGWDNSFLNYMVGSQ